MADKMKWCSSKRWSVSVITGSGIDGARLSVYRHIGRPWGVTKMTPGEGNGRMFPNDEAAWAWVQEHGYCERYQIPACTKCRVRHTTQYGDGPTRRSAYCPVTQTMTFS